MVQHPELAKGDLNSSDARTKSKELWDRLTLDLYAAAVPSRDANGWNKVWADYRNHIKVKVKLIRFPEHSNLSFLLSI